MTESTHRTADVSSLPSLSYQASISSTNGTSNSNLPNGTPVTGATRPLETPKVHVDTVSDKATAAFIRRTLCSYDVLLGNGERATASPRPIEEVLPSLTSSNEIDLQLYAIISVIIKDFVQTWYSKITPDHVFVNEVIQIIAHCTRALEQRLQNVDLEALLLDEIPELVQSHLNSYHLAKAQVKSSPSLASDPRLVYHILHPHPALSPVPNNLVPATIFEQRESESAWRQLLVQGLLAVLLPTEDLENGCLRALVAEIFAEMIIGNGISGKACEGWLLWESTAKIAEVLHTNSTEEIVSQVSDESFEQKVSRLERYGLLSSAREEELKSSKRLAARLNRRKFLLISVSRMFWAVLQYAFWAFTAVRALILIIATSSSLPRRVDASEQSFIDIPDQPRSPQGKAATIRHPLAAKRPVVSMKLWSCVAQFADLNVRMPWLLGIISILHNGALIGPGRVGETDGVLDRFLSHNIRKRILDPAFVPGALRTLRTALFPNNALGPPRQIPSDEEATRIKNHCAASLLDLLPPQVATVVFASVERNVQLQEVEATLNCFEDAYMNKHLVYQIVELLVVRLAPELGQRGVQELMEERMDLQNGF